VDNPPQRYSPWISIGQFGGSVIHRYLPVDDVDIHHQIYILAHWRARVGNLSKLVHILFQNNEVHFPAILD
jgi:hypothetical protein